MNMELENMNGVAELSMDELAVVNGGSLWSVIKSAVSWVSDHGDDIKEGVSLGKKVVDFFRKIF
jgi:hypothetical protein